VGGFRLLRMKIGQIIRRSPHPAPVGRPDYYKRELQSSLFIRSVSHLPTRPFLIAELTEPKPVDNGRQCFQRYGYYPLNFSFPRPELMPITEVPRPHFLSTTIPGEAFSFDSWDDYLAEYRSAYFALSTKKGGWDTFRHLEILFSGSIPLMPRLEAAHKFSLAHFPKRALIEVLRSLRQEGPAVPDPETRMFFQDFARSRLTTAAMATYVLEVAALGQQKILFLDRDLALRPDYLSAFALIGLLQVKGSDVVPAFVPEYLFDDYSGDTGRLYGRGFGYSQVLASALRPRDSLTIDTPARDVATMAEGFDSIFVGNFDANRSLVAELLDLGVPSGKFVCVVGSDIPPDFALRRGIRGAGMTFFVREFAGI